jgi:hypothetical protein
LAEVATLPPLPDQKTKGWEFTDLSGLDLDSYEPASPDVSIEPVEGATVMSLAEAAEAHPELVEGRLRSTRAARRSPGAR